MDYSTDEVPEMTTQTIDLAVRDDISSQSECSFKVLYAGVECPQRTASVSTGSIWPIAAG